MYRCVPCSVDVDLTESVSTDGQSQGVGEHHVMHVALMTRLDEGLQTNHVVLGGQLWGAVYLQ